MSGGEPTFEDSQSESRHDSDSNAVATFLLVCLDCGHVEKDADGNRRIVDAKENALGHYGNARQLKKIHEAQRPDHRPFIETHTMDDVHYPEWAEERHESIIEEAQV